MNPPDSPTRVLGYRRVSTDEQHRSGLGLDDQAHKLTTAAAARGWEFELVTEDAASGKSLAKRPQLADALLRLKAGEAKALAVAKLDRLSRSVLDFARLLQQAEREGWSLIVLDMNVDTTTPEGKLFAHMVAAFAEFERDQIRARTRAAFQAKKRKGERLGQKRKTPDSIVLRAVREREAGSTWQKIADGLNRDGVPTTRGGKEWRVSSVQALVRAHRLDREAEAARTAAA